MAPLRRRTSNVLMSAVAATTVVALILGGVALVYRPEARLPALAVWVFLAVGVQRLEGSRFSRESALFAGAFTLPLVLVGLAAYELRTRWAISTDICFLILACVVVLFGAVFVRALIASGSADYPYDD